MDHPEFPDFRFIQTDDDRLRGTTVHYYVRVDGSAELWYRNCGNGVHHVSVAPAHETLWIEKYGATGDSPEQAFRDATDELRIVARRAIRERERSISSHLKEIDKENAMIDALRSCLPA